MYPQQLKSTIPSNESYYKDVIDSTQYPTSLINSVLNDGPSYFDVYADIFEDSAVDRNLEWVYSLESSGLSDKETLSDYDTAEG